MSAPERQAFETALTRDPALRLLYEQYLTLVEGIKESKRQELNYKLEAWDAQMPPVAQRKMPLWKIAASIVLLITLSVTLFLYKTAHTQELTAHTYVEEPGLPVLMGASQAWAPAMNAYRSNQFEKALHEIPAQAGEDTTAFFKGILYLKLQQPAAALAKFTDMALTTSAYSEKAAYYRAYALWQSDQKKEAKAVFQEIAQQPGHVFQKEARQVLASGSL
ncbi:hypothetical protein GU926_10105 [Nibribacter ruber]|uniref:Tetratricopeptide repeat protein n=1 Tax=Nibribacter ruber TaxID=2698458 RepID=A0A6P1P1T2_9BACT|nr:hypothetical protein [Nibribacter ruber]QHL87762.1 hypothetical protein GU926_10105 [Nibribacter ruber]